MSLNRNKTPDTLSTVCVGETLFWIYNELQFWNIRFGLLLVFFLFLLVFPYQTNIEFQCRKTVWQSHDVLWYFWLWIMRNKIDIMAHSLTEGPPNSSNSPLIFCIEKFQKNSIECISSFSIIYNNIWMR